MNVSVLPQLLGNVCVCLAALLYVAPLQLLLWEFSRKRVDSGGVLAVLLILGPMWLLLTAAMLCVAANAGFDWMRLERVWLYAVIVPATFSLAVVSSFSFERVPLAGRPSRLLVGSLIHVLTLLTMAWAVFDLNPSFAPTTSPQSWGIPWVICAGVSLALCAGYAGYRLANWVLNWMRDIAHRVRQDLNLSKTALAEIETLDPAQDFKNLARRTECYEYRAVRDAALARLRRNPDFIARLLGELANATASSGELEHALAVVEFASFTPEEKTHVALPARTAMNKITRYIGSEVRHFAEDRRRRTYRWGRQLFYSIARKFYGSGVDFQPAIQAFESAFGPQAKRAP